VWNAPNWSDLNLFRSFNIYIYINMYNISTPSKTWIHRLCMMLSDMIWINCSISPEQFAKSHRSTVIPKWKPHHLPLRSAKSGCEWRIWTPGKRTVIYIYYLLLVLSCIHIWFLQSIFYRLSNHHQATTHSPSNPVKCRHCPGIQTSSANHGTFHRAQILIFRTTEITKNHQYDNVGPLGS
jgi:hypothetical protein